jgi:hypothetical protein
MYQGLQPNRGNNMFDMNTAGEESLCCDNLKPFKKICISLLFMVVGSWQTPGVTKGMKSGLDLQVITKSSIRHTVIVSTSRQSTREGNRDQWEPWDIA